MDTVTKIKNAIEASLKELGYEVVRILLSGDKKKHLQIMLDRLDGNPVTIDDCMKASNHISIILDVEDPIDEYYDLEVSSPGLDRPMVKFDDYVRFNGEKINVKLYEEVLGRKTFKGIIVDTDKEKNTVIIELVENGEDYEVEFSNIRKANIIPDIKF